MLRYPGTIHFKTFSILLFLVAALATTSCISTEHSQTVNEEEGGDQLHLHQHHPEPSSADLSELEAIYWSRLEASRSSFTQADVDFMTDMIAHHAQALIMSRLAPENDASRAVQTLAARIHNAQGDEIATMQKWLRDRGQAVPEVHIDGLMLMIRMKEPEQIEEDHHRDEHQHTAEADHMDHEEDHSHHQQHTHDVSDEEDPQMMMAHHHHHDMPGMLTQEQLEELAEARGTEFDYKFLAFMIEHHLGAVYMVDQLFGADGAANDNEIFDLASDIHAEQVTEINRMRLMLEEIESAM